MSDHSTNSNDSKNWILVPLTPEYREAEHGAYVKAIDEALNDPKIRNIALSGNYGVGKSSILQHVAYLRENRVVELSLSTLAPIGDTSLDESVPKQAATPTNRIQQEIVKQLLYRERPKKTPGSRFHRIERFNWGREVAIATLTGVAIAGISLVAGWTTRIQAEIAPLAEYGLWNHAITFTIATIAMIAFRYLFHGRFHLRNFSAGSATVTLDDKSVSYFDQYLDEIVYFFEVSRRNIVIFEDIDRFDNSRIFETLHSLNTLLNNSPQTDTPIRFIYAIKDSIFDRIGLELEGRNFEPNHPPIDDPAQAEAVRANRTKFFDLVIPVVPFITHRSATSLTIQLLNQINHNVDPKLIDLAGRYVPDMRLLSNVCNEFIVFRDRVFSGEGEHLKLNETSLFAMMLYKSTHLSDFENLRIGRSKLDQVYENGRNLVVSNIKRIQHEERMIHARLGRLDSVNARSSELGDQLIAYTNRVIGAARYNHDYGQYHFQGKSKTEHDLKSTEFWEQFAQAPDSTPLEWSARNNPHQKLWFTRSHVAEALDCSLNPEDWYEEDRARLTSELEKLRADLQFLRSADMGDLIGRPEFTVEYMGEQHSLDGITRHLFTEGLVYQLIRAGYIDRNFTLYTSTFHGERVSSAATNFIIHHVERDVMDEYFELEEDDIEAVIRERGESALQEPALYNIAILDYLVRTERNGIEVLTRSLARFGAAQKRFLEAYLNQAEQRSAFVERFTRQSPRILVYLVGQVNLDEQVRRDLVSAALANLSDGLNYQTNADVSQYLERHTAELTALTSELIGQPGAELIGNLFSNAGVRVHALEPLADAVRKAFIAQNRYLITRENLTIALGGVDRFPLDIARKTNKGIYNYLIENLDAYLSVVHDISYTVSSNASFIPVLEDVLASDGSKIGKIVGNVSAECIVENIEEVSEDAWPCLAYYGRITPSLRNCSLYIKTVGSLDASLANLLSASSTITDHENGEEHEKAQLAQAILSACEFLPSASHRVQLAASMDLEHYLDASSIPAENGDLFSLLLSYDLVPDNAETFAHLYETDWPTREAVISVSTQFKEYMTPELVQKDLAAILSSAKVDFAIKSTIAERASDYCMDSGKKNLVQLARFANRHEFSLPLDVIEEMARSNVPAPEVLFFLKPHLSLVSRDQLFRILESLGGDYSRLTSVGGGKLEVPNTTADCALAEALKEHGTVSSYKSDSDRIKIYKRRK